MKHIFVFILCLLPLFSFAANMENLPTSVTQPDGSVLELLASGDEYANRLHDAAGYTIIQSATDGYFYYAGLQDGEPVPSPWRVGSCDPSTKNLSPNINISHTAYLKKVEQMKVPLRGDGKGPNTGTVNNLTVYIRFSDQTEFEDSRAVYDARFNTVGSDAYSLRNYFHEVSYGQLDYVTYHYPVCAPELNLSYQDSHPRNYYVPYNMFTNPIGYGNSDERTMREQTMLANAITAIAPQVPASLNIDADNDDGVDNVCFIIRGAHTAWAELLWAHRWALYYTDASINGKQVWDFTFQPENQNSVRTLCHEMFHSVGAPDLYHYAYNGVTPAGCWDIMESGNGHMGMYMKQKYGGWINAIPTISSGTYILNPVNSSTNSAYRINLSGSNQFLVVEYRKQGSDIFEQDLPGSGLLIYRINDDMEGNASGPPDEVYIYRLNGTTNINGLIADATFSANEYRTEFNSFTNPACFLSSGAPSAVSIHSIGEAGDTITFTLAAAAQAVPPVISSISPADASVLSLGGLNISVNANAPNSTITGIDFSIDGNLFNTSATPPYSVFASADLLPPGYHEIVATAYAANGLSSSGAVGIRIVDPSIPNWFSWLSSDPVWEEYGRGAVPIKVAIDLDLGTEPYLVKKLAFNVVTDPWGFPQIPGLINARINRFAAGAITETTLLDIGDIYSPMNGRFEYTVNSAIPISGKIALILDLYEYQNIVFDTNAVCGHSWLTEPDRPWTDALGRGILGAAGLELQLQSPNVASDDDLVPIPAITLSNYPNPFNPTTTIRYCVTEPSQVTISIYNLKGQLVKALLNEARQSGSYSLTWNGLDDDGASASSGIYYYRMQAGKQSLTRRMALIK